ncbi:MAG: radical SAM family heme chaperone HemW [Bacillota bacterium]
MSFGIYVHIPFCIRKCNYCDFASFPIPAGDQVGDYLNALEMEFRLQADEIERRQGELVSLYLGGGTPTCLDPIQLEKLMQICRIALARVLPGVEMEFSVEANPGTLTREKLQVLESAGVNRISLGVQSFSPLHLEKMGRVHTPEEAMEAVSLIRLAGINNTGIDLMYGLPGQTIEEWRDTLDKAIALRPEHLSAYGLKIETGTAWGLLQESGNLTTPDEDLAAGMYDLARQLLTGFGYIQYEISNFALPRYQSRHNRLYWTNQEYLGLGLSASSYLNHCRCTNTGNFRHYLKELGAGRLPQTVKEDLTREQEMAEMTFLGLRLLEGVDRDDFARMFGVDITQVYGRQIDKLTGLRLLQWEADRLCLTPQALPLANLVFMEFV